MTSNTIEEKYKHDWRTYRKYKWNSSSFIFPELGVVETPDRIRFRQRNTYDRRRFAVLIAIFALMVVGLSLSIPGTYAPVRYRETMAAGMVPIAGLALLGYFIFVMTYTTLDILPDKIILDRRAKGGRVSIPIQELRTIEVRQVRDPKGGETNNLYVWHGPVPIYAFSIAHPADAIAHREGIMAAIGVMSGIVDSSTAPISAAPRRKFAE